MMCIVIDTNALSPVFNEKDEKHNEFKPVLDWIRSGKGKIFYGGTTYNNELKKAYKYLGVILELKRQRKAENISDANVDSEEKRVKRFFIDTDFNDSHIIAIVIVSGSYLICSLNKEHFPCFKRKDVYPKKAKVPKIYSGLSNGDLLCDKYIPSKYRKSKTF